MPSGGGVFPQHRLLLVEEREDLSHAEPWATGPNGEFLEGVGPEPQLGRMGKAQPCCSHFPFFFFLNHGKEVPQPQTIFSTFVSKRAFSVPELK